MTEPMAGVPLTDAEIRARDGVGLCICPDCGCVWYPFPDRYECPQCHPERGDRDRGPRFTFVYDTYVCIVAENKEEADAKLEEIERAVEAAGGGLSVFPAYGIEDAETGEEIRPVG